MIIPVGESGYGQEMTLVQKDLLGNITTTQSLSVRYVPLTDPEAPQ